MDHSHPEFCDFDEFYDFSDDDNWSTTAEIGDTEREPKFFQTFTPISPIKKPFEKIDRPAPKKNKSSQEEATEKRKIKEEKRKLKEEKLNKKIIRKASEH